MFNFLMGMFFVLIISPLIEDFITFIGCLTELKQCKIAKEVYNIKKEIGLNGEEEEQQKQIGFQTDCVGYEINSCPEQEIYEDQ